MKMQEFAQAYPERLSAASLAMDEHRQYLGMSPEWSQRHGVALHRYMSMGGVPASITGNVPDSDAYVTWIQQEQIPAMAQSQTQPEDIQRRMINESAFHTLNVATYGMWTPILEGQWKDTSNRTGEINFSTDLLAINALEVMRQRDEHVKAHGTEAIFEGNWDNRELNKIFSAWNGVLNEIDAHIIVLGAIAKNPNLTAVPAPLQFEASGRSRVNVDSLVIDTKHKQAIGLQTKARVTQDVYNKADPDRVIFVDGDVDLHNIHVMRTTQGRSSERAVAWPGMVAANHVASMNMQKKASLIRAVGGSQKFREQQTLARSFLAGSKVDYRDVTDIVRSRINLKLEQ